MSVVKSIVGSGCCFVGCLVLCLLAWLLRCVVAHFLCRSELVELLCRGWLDWPAVFLMLMLVLQGAVRPFCPSPVSVSSASDF